MPKKTPTITASAQRLVWQRKVDDIAQRMRQKIEIMSQFRDLGGQLKKMQEFFLFFDKSGSGYLNYEQVTVAMKKLNFLGCQREIEAFFNFYDDDCTGKINYVELSKEVYGMSGDGRPHFDFISTGIFEQLRSAIVDIGGASAYYNFSRLFRQAQNASGKISRPDLNAFIRNFGVNETAISGANLTLLCNAFDPGHENFIDVGHFTQSLIKGTMSFERKLIVKQTFNRFSSAQDMGYVSIGDLVDHFDPTYHPEVVAGLLTPGEARQQFKKSFSQGEESEGYVTLAEYLDYFKGISLAVSADQAFDMMMRNIIIFDVALDGSSLDRSMSMSFSSPTLRRLLVTHSNGTQEVVEVLDEFGMGRFDVHTAKDKAREQGVVDIAAIKL